MIRIASNVIRELYLLHQIRRLTALLASAAHRFALLNQIAGNTSRTHRTLLRRRNQTAIDRIGDWQTVSWPGRQRVSACVALLPETKTSRNVRRSAELRQSVRDESGHIERRRCDCLADDRVQAKTFSSFRTSNELPHETP